jgi:DNA gyrase/topoisomerase IV subunit A
MSNYLSITDQINTQYRTYALYVLQSRGIPNFYDGLTPVQRLILENSPVKYNKTIGLVGEVIKTGLYHHGDSSLAGAISKLARPFGCSYGVLEGDGFFGSPVNPSPSAPRYTSVKINQKVKDIISKNYDLNEKNSEGGHDWIHTEIPIGLMTHVVGIAVGYRSNILPRKFEDVVEYLQGAPKLLKPYFKDFSGKITKWMNEENTWLIESGIEIDANKKIIRIFDLPPVMRYDSFINKLEDKLERTGHDYRIENRSQSKCDLIVSLRGISGGPDAFKDVCEAVNKLCKIIVKEDIIFIKDGNVMEFSSVKEYLDHFRGHLELVKLKRLVRDEANYSRELAFLEAKLKFLNFMIEKKRSNDEIVKFLSGFDGWISTRLQKIEIVKLSVEHIKQTEIDIQELKNKIAKTKKEIKDQDKIYKSRMKDILKLVKGKNTRFNTTALFEPTHSDGIEIFQVIEEEEENIEEQQVEDEI